MSAEQVPVSLIERLHELDAKATPGPWFSDAWTLAAEGQGYRIRPYDSALVSEVRNALPELLAVVRAAKACHGHGPTGHAPRIGYCDLCDALAAFYTEERRTKPRHQRTQ